MWQENLGRLFTRNATVYPHKPALIFNGRSLTFLELNKRVNRLVSAMYGRGFQKGDRIAVLSKNCPAYWEMYGLAEKGGFILVPLNWRLKIKEVKYLLENSGSRALFVSREYVDVAGELKEQGCPVEQYYCFEGGKDFWSYEELVSSGDEVEPDVAISPGDICYIMYSSGTTGLPKGIMLTHGGQLANARVQLAEVCSGPGDVYLAVIPFFHSGGKGVSLAHFYRGCTMVIMEDFHPREILEVISRHRVTCAFLVPTMLSFMLEVPDLQSFDLSSFKTFFYAGSPMPAELLKRGINTLGPIFCQGYGLAESGPIACYLGKEDHSLTDGESGSRRLNSCGKPALDAQVRVVREGRDVEPGEVGEIIIHSNRLMKGYWNNPEKTREALRDGWLYTGDMAAVDQDGYFYIVDRKNDLIISGGENIYPREIEELLYAHPAVLEAAVIGVPDERWGETVKACVVLREGKNVQAEELIEFCKTQLASYKKPRSVDFLTELPKNPSGKVLKNVLREKYWHGRERKV